MAVAVERQLGGDEEIAPLVVAEKRLVAFARPFDRAADAPRRPRDQREFGIERVARAEIAANVAGDDAHALRRDVENAGELVLLAHDAAAAGMERGAARCRVVVADGRARLERNAGDALDPGCELHHMGRSFERRRGRRGVADLGVDADVGGSLVPQPRGVRRRRGEGIGHRRQRLEIHAHALGGVLGRADAVGDHDGNGLAGKARLVVGEHAVAREELVGRIALAERDVGRAR